MAKKRKITKTSKKLAYKQKYKAIAPFISFKFDMRKELEPWQKGMITRYSNIIQGSGLITKTEEGKYVQAVKFRKGKKSDIIGAPKIRGVFIQGAKPKDKINRKGEIDRDYYTKKFVPLDFSGVAQIQGYDNVFAYVLEILTRDLTPHWENIKGADYFSIVVANGWEIKLGNKEPLAYTKGLSKKNKLHELAEAITRLLMRSIEKYEIKENLISGVYIWKFKNQKKPTNKQKSKIKKKKKKKGIRRK